MDDNLTRTKAYEDVGNAIDDLMNACRGIAKKMSLKRAGTKVMDTRNNMMSLVPDLIKDWHESSARGAAARALIMCKAHFSSMDLAQISLGVLKSTNVNQLIREVSGFDSLFASRVNHEERYEARVSGWLHQI
jgi:hypothetical protein